MRSGPHGGDFALFVGVPTGAVVCEYGLVKLGFQPTLEEIGEAKAGIMKKQTPVVIGPDVSYAFMKKKADALSCPLI